MFSIVVLSHNRINLLKKTINSLANQTLNCSKYEIIIVDSSTDSLKFENFFFNIKKRYRKNNIKIITCKNYFDQTYKRNLAVKLSKFKWIVFIDDDVLLKTNSLEKNYLFLKKNLNNCKIISGRLLPLLELKSDTKSYLKKKKFLSKDKYYIKDFSILDLGSKKFFPKKKFLIASLFLIKKSTYIKAGGLGPDGYKGNKIFLNGSGEDNIVNFTNKNNSNILYNPDLCGKHFVSHYRFSKEYLESRNFYYGVCESFIDVREGSFLSIILLFIKYCIIFNLSKFSNYKSKNIKLAYLLGKIDHLKLCIIDKNLRKYCKNQNWYKHNYYNFIKNFNYENKYKYLFWQNSNT